MAKKNDDIVYLVEDSDQPVLVEEQSASMLVEEYPAKSRKIKTASTNKKNEEVTKAVNTVIKNINAIGPIKLGKYSKIYIARVSYEALNNEQKKLVRNIDVLVAAEKKYKELQLAKEEAQKNAEAEAAARKRIEAAMRREQDAIRRVQDAERKAKEAEAAARKNAEEEARRIAEAEAVARRNAEAAELDAVLAKARKKAEVFAKSIKILRVLLIIVYIVMIIANVIYTYLEADSWFLSVLAAIATFFIEFGELSLIMYLEQENDAEINTESPNGLTIVHLIWRIIWVTGMIVLGEYCFIWVFKGLGWL